MRPCFLVNHDGLNNLGRGSPMKHFCQVICKWVQWFLTRRFLKFPIYIYRKHKPRPLATMFLTNHDGLNILCRGSPKEHFCKTIFKSVLWFLTRRFFKVFLLAAIATRILHGFQIFEQLSVSITQGSIL